MKNSLSEWIKSVSSKLSEICLDKDKKQIYIKCLKTRSREVVYERMMRLGIESKYLDQEDKATLEKVALTSLDEDFVRFWEKREVPERLRLNR